MIMYDDFYLNFTVVVVVVVNVNVVNVTLVRSARSTTELLPDLSLFYNGTTTN